MSLPLRPLLASLLLGCAVHALADDLQVKIDTGTIEGKREGNVRAFFGIPYAAPPVGERRWKPPAPAASWSGVRQATEFGHRDFQPEIWGDYVFTDSGPSEDCLTLNVWVPDNLTHRPLPVMVWIHGGGYQAGATSQTLFDGANLAGKGVILVTMNYRLGVFGFMVHPDLAAESPDHATGNYGLMDQQEALRWVQRNIARFGGDPGNVTLFGESAGSFSVTQQMAAAGSKGLFARVIGESGGLPEAIAVPELSREKREKLDPELLAKLTGAKSLSELRAVSPEKLVAALKAAGMAAMFQFVPTVDGAFIKEPIKQVYAEGRQNDVPLLAGWNVDERTLKVPTGASAAETLKKVATDKFGANAPRFLAAFPAGSESQAISSGNAFANGQFVALGTWDWMEVQTKTGHAPVYRYLFMRGPPTDFFGVPRGSYHSAEILYVFGTLDAQVKTPWTAEDRKVSELTQAYWLNFARFGNPNGSELPHWPAYGSATGWAVQRIGVQTEAKPDEYRAGFQFLSERG